MDGESELKSALHDLYVNLPEPVVRSVRYTQCITRYINWKLQNNDILFSDRSLRRIFLMIHEEKQHMISLEWYTLLYLMIRIGVDEMKKSKKEYLLRFFDFLLAHRLCKCSICLLDTYYLLMTLLDKIRMKPLCILAYPYFQDVTIGLLVNYIKYTLDHVAKHKMEIDCIVFEVIMECTDYLAIEGTNMNHDYHINIIYFIQAYLKYMKSPLNMKDIHAHIITCNQVFFRTIIRWLPLVKSYFDSDKTKNTFIVRNIYYICSEALIWLKSNILNSTIPETAILVKRLFELKYLKIDQYNLYQILESYSDINKCLVDGYYIFWIIKNNIIKRIKSIQLYPHFTQLFKEYFRLNLTHLLNINIYKLNQSNCHPNLPIFLPYYLIINSTICWKLMIEFNINCVYCILPYINQLYSTLSYLCVHFRNYPLVQASAIMLAAIISVCDVNEPKTCMVLPIHRINYGEFLRIFLQISKDERLDNESFDIAKNMKFGFWQDPKFCFINDKLSEYFMKFRIYMMGINCLENIFKRYKFDKYFEKFRINLPGYL